MAADPQRMKTDSYLSFESVHDELQVLRAHCFDHFLNDVIAVLVLDAFDHVAFQFLDQRQLVFLTQMTFEFRILRCRNL